MKCNVGGIDMGARLVIGAVLLIVGFTVPLSTVWQAVAFVLAAIALITGLVRYCPINSLIGLNTCAREHEESQSHLKEVK